VSLSADEWPMLIVGLHGPSIPVNKLNADKTVVFGGQPNRLSEEHETYPLIEGIHSATKLCTESTIPSLGEPKVSGRGEVSLPPPVSTNHGFGAVVRPPAFSSELRCTNDGTETVVVETGGGRLTSPRPDTFGSPREGMVILCRASWQSECLRSEGKFRAPPTVGWAGHQTQPSCLHSACSPEWMGREARRLMGHSSALRDTIPPLCHPKNVQ